MHQRRTSLRHARGRLRRRSPPSRRTDSKSLPQGKELTSPGMPLRHFGATGDMEPGRFVDFQLDQSNSVQLYDGTNSDGHQIDNGLASIEASNVTSGGEASTSATPDLAWFPARPSKPFTARKTAIAPPGSALRFRVCPTPTPPPSSAAE